MKTKTTNTAFFLPYDYEGIEQELNKQMSEGWLLISMKKHSFTYTRCEPNQYRYALTYVPDASFYNPEPTKHQMILDEFCQDMGWNKTAESDYLQVYITQDPAALPIDTDDSIKLNAIMKSMRKQNKLLYFLSALDMLYLFLLYYVFFNQKSINGIPLSITAQEHLIDLLIFAGLFCYSIAPLLNYWLWCCRSKICLQTNGILASVRFHRLADTVLSFLQFVFMGLYIYTTIKEPSDLSDFLSTMIFACLIGPFSCLASNIMKNAGFSRTTNRILSILFGIIVSFFVAPIIYACLRFRGVVI